MQLQLEEATAELAASRAAHAALQAEHAQVAARYAELRAQCAGARGVLKRVEAGVALDPRLAALLDTVAAADDAGGEAAACAGGNTAEETGEDMLPLAQRLGAAVAGMHAQWRAALEDAACSAAAASQAADDRRAEAQARAAVEEEVARLRAACDSDAAQVVALQAEAARLQLARSEADAAAAAATLAQSAAECTRNAGASKIAHLTRRADGLAEKLARAREGAVAAAAVEAGVRAQLEGAGHKLVWRRRLMAENMKGFCVALQALWANQTARGLLQRRLAEERRRGRALAGELEARDARAHDLAATVRRPPAPPAGEGGVAPCQLPRAALQTRRQARACHAPPSPLPAPSPGGGPVPADRAPQGRHVAAGREPAGRAAPVARARRAPAGARRAARPRLLCCREPRPPAPPPRGAHARPRARAARCPRRGRRSSRRRSRPRRRPPPTAPGRCGAPTQSWRPPQPRLTRRGATCSRQARPRHLTCMLRAQDRDATACLPAARVCPPLARRAPPPRADARGGGRGGPGPDRVPPRGARAGGRRRAPHAREGRRARPPGRDKGEWGSAAGGAAAQPARRTGAIAKASAAPTQRAPRRCCAQARLELAAAKLEGDLAAARGRLELAAADLAAERERVDGAKSLLERKVRAHACWLLFSRAAATAGAVAPGRARAQATPPTHAPGRPQRAKKRAWKAACAAADAEVGALHGQLLARRREVAGLELRLQKLEAEVRGTPDKEGCMPTAQRASEAVLRHACAHEKTNKQTNKPIQNKQLMLLGAGAGARVDVQPRATSGGGANGGDDGEPAAAPDDGDAGGDCCAAAALVDVPEARRLLGAALQDAQDAAGELLRLDQAAEGIEGQRQALLVRARTRRTAPNDAGGDAAAGAAAHAPARARAARPRGARHVS